MFDAESDGSPEAAVMCQRFLVKRGFATADVSPTKGTLDIDTAIVYGQDKPEMAPEIARL